MPIHKSILESLHNFFENLTESIAFPMGTPTIIDVPWGKGKCNTYMLIADGLLFLGHMHLPGHDLLSSTGKECHKYLMFLYCRDMGFLNWAPCARSIKTFSIISPGVTYRCELILMIGVSYYKRKHALKYYYLLWKGYLGQYDSISKAMSMLNIPDELIRQIFTLR